LGLDRGTIRRIADPEWGLTLSEEEFHLLDFKASNHNWAATALYTVTVLAHAPLLNGLEWLSVAAMMMLVAFTFLLRLNVAVPAAVLFALLAIGEWVPLLREWKAQTPVLPLLVPLIFTTIMVCSRRDWRSTLGWMRMGGFDRTTVLLALATGAGSALALWVWAMLANTLGIGV
jgi:hypothetical protein